MELKPLLMVIFSLNLLVPWDAPTKKVGRSKEHARKKELGEKTIQNESGIKLKRGGTKYKCSICGGSGHNKNGCKSKTKIPKVSSTRFKLSVKEKVTTNTFNMNSQLNTNEKRYEDTSVAAIRIYNMTSKGNIVTQHSDGFSTVTRIYKK